MNELALATVFAAGLLGSVHCLTMCGGIATAVGASRVGKRVSWQSLLYQVGRVSSYSLAGAIAGALGAGSLNVVTARGGEILRLATALIVVIIGLDIALGTGQRARWLRTPERLGARLWRLIAPLGRVHVTAPPAIRALALGLIWGWLPCGLVYSALLAAAVAGGASAGAMTMLAFGLGTVPAMIGLSWIGTRLPRADGSLARVLGAIIVACGLWTASAPIAMLAGGHQHVHSMTLKSSVDAPVGDHGTDRAAPHHSLTSAPSR